MSILDRLAALDAAVTSGEHYGIEQDIFRAAIDEITRKSTALDALGVAIADAGYTWTPAMRDAYERGI